MWLASWLIISTLSFALSCFAMATTATTTKTILITGSTDGIGRLAAQKLLEAGHAVILHGRSARKVQAAAAQLGATETVVGDLSDLTQVQALVASIQAKYDKIDVLINNAGVFKVGNGTTTTTTQGLDVRFTVNTVAPYILSKKLWPLIASQGGRIINVSSAAQSPVNLSALRGQQSFAGDDDFKAYAQSKLALMAWTRHLALFGKRNDGPLMISVNPGSLLGTKMVREGFGTAGSDVNKGADILIRLALEDKSTLRQHNGDYLTMIEETMALLIPTC